MEKKNMSPQSSHDRRLRLRATGRGRYRLLHACRKPQARINAAGRNYHIVIEVSELDGRGIARHRAWVARQGPLLPGAQDLYAPR